MCFAIFLENTKNREYFEGGMRKAEDGIRNAEVGIRNEEVGKKQSFGNVQKCLHEYVIREK